MDFNAKFDDGLSYADFLEKYGNAEQKQRWQTMYEQVKLDNEQIRLLQGFVREMKVLVTAGSWCGDCVNQCPIFARFAEVSDRIQLRFFDRDDESELSQELSICGASRVPSVLFLSEDGFPCGRSGDRTLSKYRQMSESQLGPACPTGIHSPGEGQPAVVTQEWLDEFERIQLMLRLSGRLRTLHGD